MSLVAIVVSTLLLVFAVGQLPLVAVFVRALLRRPPPHLADTDCPQALVVLSLRGNDPFLRDCILALVQQDYPRFDVRVVIDSRTDPAWETVETVLREQAETRVQVQPLEDRLTSCSLKCSSVLQALADLDESHQFVALLDADTVPHASWLRELAGGFQDPAVGAVTGNRWYAPRTATWGSLVRYCWNGAAVVQMYVYRIAWGGTLAVRTDLLRIADLRKQWGNAFCEDTMLTSMLRPHGFRVQFIPSLMMVNRENCSIAGFDAWVRRQLLTARLYHPSWPAVAGHGMGTSAVIWLAVGTLAAAVSLGHGPAAFCVAMALIAYQACMFLSLLLLEFSVRQVVHRRGEEMAWLSITHLLRVGLALPLTQTLYTRALLAAARLRHVSWRGVEYEIRGPWDIRLVRDQGSESPSPYASPDESL